MDDNRKTALKPITTDLGKWTWRIVVAVILGEAIWGFLVAITNDLILPLTPRTMGGGRPVNVPGVLGSVIELCLAGTVAILLKSWSTKYADSRAKPTSVEISTPVPAAAAGRNVASIPIALAAAAAGPANAPATKVNSVPSPASPPPKAQKPEKTKPPKEVYYNIVGEPVDTDED